MTNVTIWWTDRLTGHAMEAITMLLRTVNHLFLWAIYTMAMLNNQRVDTVSLSISLMEFCWFLHLKWSESMFLNQPSSKVCLKINQHQAASSSINQPSDIEAQLSGPRPSRRWLGWAHRHRRCQRLGPKSKPDMDQIWCCCLLLQLSIDKSGTNGII